MPAPSTPRPKGIDYDSLTKDLVTTYFDLFIQLACPSLYNAIDWSVQPDFLEQELFNRLKGRYKIKGKQHKTDKFVRLRLLNGTDYYIYVHCEFQHRPHKGYARRMYTYFVLAFLDYEDMEQFSSITFFTGAPPKKDEMSFTIDCFGTKLTYQFVGFVAVNQNEQDLLVSDNPFSLAVLAALYAQKTVKNLRRRTAYKEKLVDLAIKKGWTDERWEKLITFVLDFVHLPEVQEREFAASILKKVEPSPINDETMPEQASFAVRNFAEAIYKKVYGFDPQEVLKTAQRDAAAAAQREAEERERRIIFALNQVSKMPAIEIATVLNVTVEYVENVIQRALAERAAMTVAAENNAQEKEKTPRRRAAGKSKK